MVEPADALTELATMLEAEGSVISPHVVEPAERPALGPSPPPASGPPPPAASTRSLSRRSARATCCTTRPGGSSPATDPDLALLAGDYLYALGLERLAALGDLAAVRELSDLISLAAQIHDTGRSPERAAQEAAALWLACAMAIAAGPGDSHERSKVGAAIRLASRRPASSGRRPTLRPPEPGSGSR